MKGEPDKVVGDGGGEKRGRGNNLKKKNIILRRRGQNKRQHFLSLHGNAVNEQFVIPCCR